jgi:hypothetical protein
MRIHSQALRLRRTASRLWGLTLRATEQIELPCLQCHSNGLIVISSDTVRQVGYWFSQVLHRRIGAAPFLSVIARALPQYPAFVVMAPVFMMACAAFALTILFFFPGYLTRDASFVHSYAQEWYLGDWQSPLMTILWRLIRSRRDQAAFSS